MSTTTSVDHDLLFSTTSSTSSDDSSWLPDIDDDGWGGVDDEDEGPSSQWVEEPLLGKNMIIEFDTIDSMIQPDFLEEIKGVKANILSEIKIQQALSGEPQQETGTASSSNIFNCFLTEMIAVEIMKIMNDYLVYHKRTPVRRGEFQGFIRLICWMAYYGQSLTEMFKHPDNFPGPTDLINEILIGSTQKERQERAVELFRSLDGAPKKQNSMTWDYVFKVDENISQLMTNIGLQSSKLCCIKGRTKFVIDDDKLHHRAENAVMSGFSRTKGLKTFGPVSNCLNSLATGINLSSKMSHHGDNAANITKVCMGIASCNISTTNIDMDDVFLCGDRGYNQEDEYKLADDFVFTVKRGPSQQYTFGKTHYNVSRDDQIEIPEGGPFSSYGATRAIEDPETGDIRTAYFTAVRNGTGRVTFLQSTKPELKFSNFQYVSKDPGAMNLFLKKAHGSAPAGPPTIHTEIAQRIGVIPVTEGQRDESWRIAREFFFTSTSSHEMLPRSTHGLPMTQRDILDAIGSRTTSDPSLPPDPSYQNRSIEELMAMTGAQLKQICQSYQRPYSGSKAKKVEEIRKGPKPIPTDFERALRARFLKPLRDTEKSPRKIGLANENSVLHALPELMKELTNNPNCHVLHILEYGLLIRNDGGRPPALATSVDALVVYKCGDGPTEIVAVEIKTPTSKKVMRRVKMLRDSYGRFSQCNFGDNAFKSLVYEARYRTQVLHHSAVTNLNVVFIVANKNIPVFATKIDVSPANRQNYISLLEPVYNRTLAWAHTTAFDAEEPDQFIPEFREHVVSQSGYAVDRQSVLVHYVLWRKLLKLVIAARTPIPRAKYIVPSIVAFWDMVKGSVDIMTRYLSEIAFPIQGATVKSVVVLREIEKMALNSFLVEKFCIHDEVWIDNANRFSLSSIRKIAKKWHPFRGFMHSLAKGYFIASTSDSGATVTSEMSHSVEEIESLSRQERQQKAVKLCSELKVKRRETFETVPVYKRIRLDRELDHWPVLKSGDEESRRCVYCSFSRQCEHHSSNWWCPTCQVHLCLLLRDDSQGDNCFKRFHEEERFELFQEFKADTTGTSSQSQTETTLLPETQTTTEPESLTS